MAAGDKDMLVLAKFEAGSPACAAPLMQFQSGGLSKPCPSRRENTNGSLGLAGAGRSCAEGRRVGMLVLSADDSGLVMAWNDKRTDFGCATVIPGMPQEKTESNLNSVKSPRHSWVVAVAGCSAAARGPVLIRFEIDSNDRHGMAQS